MIEVKDRIPTYPGRVKLTPVVGETDTYDMVRADSPIEPGTPINKALFDGITGRIDDAIQAIDNKIFELSQRMAIGSMSDGSILGLYENGVLVPYIKLMSNYSASGRTVIVRKDITHLVAAYSEANQSYLNSPLDVWLNNEFPLRLDAATQSALREVSIAVPLGTDSSSANRKVFVLSLGEYQIRNVSNIAPLSINYPVFSNDERRVALYNGVPTPHHTRSSNTSRNIMGIVNANGQGESVNMLTVAGVRPAFTLPDSFEVVAGAPSTANVMATAEVI